MDKRIFEVKVHFLRTLSYKNISEDIRYMDGTEEETVAYTVISPDDRTARKKSEELFEKEYRTVLAKKDAGEKVIVEKSEILYCEIGYVGSLSDYE